MELSAGILFPGFSFFSFSNDIFFYVTASIHFKTGF